MNDPYLDYRRHDRLKYNEFHKDGQKEDRTTAEIIEIATALEDGAIIRCVTWLWPNTRLEITLDNQFHKRVVDISVVVSNASHYQFRFKRHDDKSIQRRGSDPWLNGVDMHITDVVECFGLDDQKIKNPEPPAPGIWTGWFLMGYRGPRPDDPV